MSILSILAIFVNYKTGKRHHRDSLLFKKENAILKSAHTHLSKKNDFLASRIVSFQIVFKEKKQEQFYNFFSSNICQNIRKNSMFVFLVSRLFEIKICIQKFFKSGN